MTEQQPETLTCPRCGNINTYQADKCLKCGLSLGPVRDAVAGQEGSVAVETSPAPAKPKEPAPPLPELPRQPTAEKKPSYFVDSWSFLIRGMGDRAEEVAARFFKQLDERGIEKLRLFVGTIVIDLEDAMFSGKSSSRQDSREYYFAEHDLGNGAAATMAVRIAPMGRDLFVEWRHYTTPPLGALNWGIYFRYLLGAILVSGAIAAVIMGLGLFAGIANRSNTSNAGGDLLSCGCCAAIIVGGMALLAGAVVARTNAAGKGHKGALEGFQVQDSTAFQLAVRAALEEAIDLAGISKALIQELPKEATKAAERRVI